MASPSGLTSKTNSMDAFACNCVCEMNFVQKKGSEYREVRECMSRSQNVRIEKSESKCREVQKKRTE